MNQDTSSQRQMRYGELIRSLISECLIKTDFYEQNSNFSEVTVSFVKMSKDLKIANVYIMPLGGKDQQELIEGINKNKYIFQKYLSKAKIKSKYTPKINFYIDDTFDEAQKIEKLLSDNKILRDLNE
tara:strand:+ start:797 stop:1177 length:381 start_codon:yes stop_codon:yes gene_type:complete